MGLGGQHRPQIDVVSNLQAEEFLKIGDVVIDYTHPVGEDQENCSQRADPALIKTVPRLKA